MRLLVFTQAVDMTDPVMGFFHNWLRKFSKEVESITVICLKKGDYDLPSNVKVLSLGKEGGKSKFKYIFRFYKYIWKERKNYEKVFVHMNQEYVLLGGIIWWLLNRHVFMWRNHKKGNFLTRIAVYLSHKVFCTSPNSYTAKFKKTILMPVGIDTDIFKPNPDVKREARSIVMLGRLSPVKRVDLFVDALLKLQEKGLQFKSYIIGSSANSTDDCYEKALKFKAKPLTSAGLLFFLPAVTQEEAREIYQRKEICVNLTPAGSMDKTIFEAEACGALTIVDKNDEVKDLDKKIEEFLNLDDFTKLKYKKEGRDEVVRDHSLNLLADKLIITISS